jgi:uncharacterized protein (TIGR02677 family)
VETIIRQDTLPSADNCAQLWNDVFTYFRKITKNTADYIAHINSEEAEERMQTEAFLVFKDQFTAYLRDFIVGLQQTALKIQELLTSIRTEQLKPLISEVIAHEKQIPRFAELGLTEAEQMEEHHGKWTSLKSWFLGDEHGESELDMLQVRTNEQIRRITRVVQRLGERHHYFRSRKKDYLHLAQWFDTLGNIGEAHELSAVVFGVFHTRHLFSDHVPTEDIYTDVWDEQPISHETKPRIRNYREKTRPGAVISQREKKEEIQRAYLRNKQQEQEALEKYMNGNEILMKELPKIETHVRKMLLNWISRAMSGKNRTFKTEHGRHVRMTLSEESRVILRAEDGTMEMPDVTFHFLDEVKI